MNVYWVGEVHRLAVASTRSDDHLLLRCVEGVVVRRALVCSGAYLAGAMSTTNLLSIPLARVLGRATSTELLGIGREIVALVEDSLVLLLSHAFIFIANFWISIKGKLLLLSISILLGVLCVARVELHIGLVLWLHHRRLRLGV